MGLTRIQLFLECLGIKNYFCGIGESSISDKEIKITAYPFKPSLAYPSIQLKPEQIAAITVGFSSCGLYVQDDILFVSEEKKELLKDFAKRNQISLVPHNFN